MADPVCFVDCETTGLDPERHVPWEIAYVADAGDGSFEAYCWIFQLTGGELAAADAAALRVGDYYKRECRVATDWRNLEWEPQAPARPYVTLGQRHAFAHWLVRLIGTKHLGGNAVAFDARFIGDFLRRQSVVPVWHYHLVDVEALAAGWLQQPPPWRSTDLSERVGVDPKTYDRHTAAGDANWAKAIYDAVMRAQVLGVEDWRRQALARGTGDG